MTSVIARETKRFVKDVGEAYQQPKDVWWIKPIIGEGGMFGKGIEPPEGVDPFATLQAAQIAQEERAKIVADKKAVDKKKVDEEAKKASTLLAKRRRGASPFATPGGAQGLLGQAPVQLKTLLGQ